MLVNKIILDAAKPLVIELLKGNEDYYFEGTHFINTWESYAGYCPSDIIDQLKIKVRSVDTIAQDMGWRVFQTTDLVVVEKDFKGWIETAVIIIDDNEQYSQYANKKISEYNSSAYSVVNSEELRALIDNHNKSFITAPELTNAEHYNDMLEILPPCRWHVSAGNNYFHVSERITGNLVRWFCSVGGQYYTFINDANISTSKLNEIIREAV